jgi:uncharacterized membrane protein (DUF106 family)
MSWMKMLTQRGLWFVVAAMIAALLISFPSTVCAADSRLEQVKKDLAEAGQAIKNFTAVQKDEAVRKAETALQAMDKEIEAMRPASNRTGTRWIRRRAGTPTRRSRR